ncbi:carboxyl-terminal proteinase [Metarhizium rileyi]|uniref:Carboxyl-terminal proteinase n=1 Tax=Metarhizium rileyi (strain RCEF 4871) TaxID=1649241 RepID=A0A167KIQ7_METRR|nr:carboxyl-terminal proteinase [Metarhizium rileyi RCEF 4871]
MKLSIFPGLALAGLATTAPVTSSSPPRHGLPIVKTTTTRNGQTLDWVPMASQGNVARPPPLSLLKRAPTWQDAAMVDAIKPQVTGPEGTVPILRAHGPTKPMKRLPRSGDNHTTTTATRSYQGKHWYASTAQTVENHGGSATYSIFKAFVQRSSDFSLLQVAVIRNNASHAETAPKSQTIECGWINYPDQVFAPHLFSFYTTNNYESYGDNVCGWNRDVAGWVQYDSIIYPGIAFAPLATIGGTGYEADIGYYYYEGNWWLSTLGKFVGYYPGSLFSKDVDPAGTLDHHADQINFYGEIYNSEDEMTTTDMGSGAFPDEGRGKAAYMRKIVYYDTRDKVQDYDGSRAVIVSDPNRYRLTATWKSGSEWGSYFYIGGPGAGGVVGG